uniref:Cathepsin A4 n=1 Tax=Tigriopus japonicus TaxID=158387 RepID=A0A0H4KPF5_TIGJA|nr:cathepsin A4 [Tigriopus japonicus]
MQKFLVFVLTVGVALAYRPLRPQVHKQIPAQGDVGEPLYLTPLIQSGDITTAQDLARVTDPLPGTESTPMESYSGFITVDEAFDSNTFFWFFPAQEVDPAEAPVVIWLQGGPGSSSLFGLLELHGPIITRFDENGDTVGTVNEYTWAKKANMLYIDNPVGSGYSYTKTSGLPTSQEDVAIDLYEFLIQWFTMFPQYQANEFYAFGESYGGKWVPTIAKKIHDENPTADLKINLAGIGIGDGFMSPPETAVYGDYLYQVGLVDEKLRDELLEEEQRMKNHVANEEWFMAWSSWNKEFDMFLSAMGCPYYYEITLCNTDPEEDNYEVYAQSDVVRKAIHAGDRPFGSQSGAVYNSMLDDFMRPERETVEFLLNNYKVLIYDGNFDIICNHSGILDMFAAMTTWTGLDKYYQTDRSVFKDRNGDVVGYLKSVDNLRMFVMRNAGHMVPLSQPLASQDMFEQFLDGSL